MSQFDRYCAEKRLGAVQKDVLKALIEHGIYYHREIGGWCWDTPSGTLRIMESLAAKYCVRRDVALDCETGRSCEVFEPEISAIEAFRKADGV